MPPNAFNLAIETSTRRGGIALGRGDELLEAVALDEQRRHAVELLPAADALCKRHGAGPADLAELYVSVGPGSFTGLRIGVTTAKAIARAVGCRIVAVSTLDAVARNAPDDLDEVAVMLNAKRGQWYTGLYERRGDTWTALMDPALLTPAELLDRRARLRHTRSGQSTTITADPPLHVIADASAARNASDWPRAIQLLDPALATPRPEVVWQLGREAAKQDSFTDPLKLAPLYVRPPEAEEVWQAKQNR